MAEISVSTQSLEEEIGKLQTLKTNCADFDVAFLDVVGGGQTITELEQIANLYKKLNTDMVDLISNTISFMENVKNSYMSSDKKAATKLSG